MPRPLPRPLTRPLPQYLVGVDGGGTGTRARLQDSDGRTLGTGQAGPSGLGLGVEQAWRHVREAVEQSFAEALAQAALPARPPLHQVALGLGLAGAGVPAQSAAFLQMDPGFARCVLRNDGLTQLLGAHPEGAGLVVASGTGSVAMARHADGRMRQAGGWGFPVGDEGSGAWLGLHAMRHAQHVLDGRVAPSLLSQAVMRQAVMQQAVMHQAGTDAAALLAWCAGAGQNTWAQLAPLVFDAAEAGDAQAQTLLQAAADALAALVRTLDMTLDLTRDSTLDLSRYLTRDSTPNSGLLPGAPIVMCGSVGERLLPRWPEALRSRLVAPAGDSADGALRLLRAALAGEAWAS